MTIDFFCDKAEGYDQSEERTNNVGQIARAIRRRFTWHADMHILDFGSGTGLLLERIAPLVGHITAVDISPSMNAQLEQKRERLPCEIEIQAVDLTREPLPLCFDGIISSMTLHHIEEILGLFSRLYGLLKPGGFFALADLESEDGTFHEVDTGVFHFGFAPSVLAETARQAGFRCVVTQRVNVIRKPSGEYPVFLLTAIA